MATTFVDYTGDGNATKSFSFPSIKEADIKVDVDGIIKTSGSHYNITSYTTTGGGNVVFTSGNIPTSPSVIRIFRDTDVDTAKATFTAGSSIKAGDLNNNMTQILYAAQEEQNQTIKASDIKDSVITSAKLVDGTIVADDLADDAVTTAKIAANAVTMAKLNSGALPTDITVASANIVDGTIATADIADDAVTNSKLENMLTARIMGRVSSGTGNPQHLSASEARSVLNVEDGATADQTNAEIKTAYEANSDTNAFTDADHSKLDGIETGATADQTVSEIKSLIAGSPLDASHLAANSVDSSELVDGSIDTSHIADSQVTTAKIASTSVTDAKLASNSVTTSKITDANVTTVKIADDAISIAKIGCEQTTISDSDSHIPTSGAVVDYVAAQIAPIGGLEVIADEDNFPTTQPSSGVVISISDAAGIVVNGSGVSTTARTAGNGSDNVTINNFPSSLHGETLASGVGLMVSSTGSSNTYNYHKVLAAETDVKQLSDDINDFNARYRVSAGEPSSNNDEGDLVYDTNADKMKVYDSSTSAWKEVTSTGDFKYLFLCPAGGSGSPTLNGSIATYDLRESSNSGSAASVTSAAQLMVSINGVIQKPNTGTSAPSEGFALVDANTIIFGSNLASGDSVFIVQSGSAVSIPTPGDGTVSAAKIASGAVTTAKIADDAVTQAKIADDAVGADQLASSAVVTASMVDDAVTQAKIADEAIDEARLQISNAPVNGYVLTAQSGNTGGMTWQLAAAGATGGNSNANGVFWENENTVTHDYTIQNNHNAGSFGPITINNGVTVTVGSGENWTIV